MIHKSKQMPFFEHMELKTLFPIAVLKLNMLIITNMVFFEVEYIFSRRYLLQRMPLF